MRSWRSSTERWRSSYHTWRAGLRGRRVAEASWRLLVLVVGLAVAGVGVVLLPLPGPGWVIIFVGLGILAAEFAWAQRLLLRARGYYERLKAAALRRRQRGRERTSGGARM